MANNDRPVPERLLEGARTLGKFWREAKCATAGWSVKKTQDGGFEPCTCEPKTKFCKAKMQWLKLAAEEPREIVEGDFGLPFGTMKGAEWDATGCTLDWELEGVGMIKVGPNGGVNMRLLMELSPDPVSGIAAIKVMMKFRNSKMEFAPAEAAGAKAVEAEGS